MEAIVSLALALLEAIVPQLSGANAALITKIIEGLVALIPLLVKEYNSVIPFIQNVITLLKNNNQVTPDQLAQLDQLEATLDAAFETAATNAIAEDAAAEAANTTPKS